MDKVLVIDGNNTIHRSFHIAKIKTGSPSELKERLITMFMRSIKLLVKKYDPDKVVIAWDKRQNVEGAKALRKTINTQYKQGRPTDNSLDVLYSSLVDIEIMLEHLDIINMFPIILEADDIMAHFSLNRPDDEVIIVSGDNDLLQLAGVNDTIIYNPLKKIDYDRSTFIEKYDFAPEEFVFYKSLVGDNSDNIAGIPGVGEKTALKYIRGEKVLTEDQKKIVRNNTIMMDLRLINANTKNIVNEREDYESQIDKKWDYNYRDALRFDDFKDLACLLAPELLNQLGDWKQSQKPTNTKSLNKMIGNFDFLT